MSKPETVAVSPIPAGLHTVTPRLVVGDGAAAITFYRQAFGAEERPGHRSTWATRSAASSPMALASPITIAPSWPV